MCLPALPAFAEVVVLPSARPAQVSAASEAGVEAVRSVAPEQSDAATLLLLLAGLAVIGIITLRRS